MTGRPARRRPADVHVYRERRWPRHRVSPRQWKAGPSGPAPTFRWIVASGARRLSRHRTQAAALRAAIRLARRRQVDVVTHGRHGRVRSKDSYGNESCVRDTEH